ncbi:hypothetical protein H7J52_23430 [Mycobacterium gordonae]|uniref:hypothetical protein n=1 Tax=Mycobacterium gordonae TaxID=1778 RepID=UPI0021F27082|nr:hypothetical protein [Mycobacterium gordonae]MCV7008723.1 hypothetical protein [Mycobacterium gordonae]
MATHNEIPPVRSRDTATAQSKPGSITDAAPARSATAIRARPRSVSALSRTTCETRRRPPTGIKPAELPPAVDTAPSAAAAKPAGDPAPTLAGAGLDIVGGNTDP